MVGKYAYHYLILAIVCKAGYNTLQFIKHLILVASKVMEEISNLIFKSFASIQSTLPHRLKKENLPTTQPPKITYQVWSEKSNYDPANNAENKNRIRMFILDEEVNLSRKYYSS